MKSNPAKAVDYIKSENPDGFHSWTGPECRTIQGTASSRDEGVTRPIPDLVLGSAVRTATLLWRSPSKAKPETRVRTNVATFSGVRAGGSTSAKKAKDFKGEKSRWLPGLDSNQRPFD